MTRAPMLLLGLLLVAPAFPTGSGASGPDATLQGQVVVIASNGLPLEIAVSATRFGDGTVAGFVSIEGYNGANLGGNYHGKWAVAGLTPPGARDFWCLEKVPLVTQVTTGNHLLLVEDRGSSLFPPTDRLMFTGGACVDYTGGFCGCPPIVAGDFVSKS